MASSIDIFDILARRKKAPIAVASPQDFDLRFSRSEHAAEAALRGLPYCADFASKRLMYALCRDDLQRVLYAPFLYLAQFEAAEQIATVPFGRLAEMERHGACQPTFIFSIGRCGSTFLVAALNAAGLSSVSEPDVLTQVAQPAVTKSLPEQVDPLIRACLMGIRHHVGPDFAVKLRSQCNGIAVRIARLFPNATFVYLLRTASPWAESRLRAFHGEPKVLAGQLKWGIDTIHALARETGQPPLVLWYEDLIADPVSAVQRLFRAERPSLQAAIARVSSQDSQAGSSLDRSVIASRNVSRERLKRFYEEWKRVRPSDLIEKYSLQRIE